MPPVLCALWPPLSPGERPEVGSPRWRSSSSSLLDAFLGTAGWWIGGGLLHCDPLVVVREWDQQPPCLPWEQQWWWTWMVRSSSGGFVVGLPRWRSFFSLCTSGPNSPLRRPSWEQQWWRVWMVVVVFPLSGFRRPELYLVVVQCVRV